MVLDSLYTAISYTDHFSYKKIIPYKNSCTA